MARQDSPTSELGSRQSSFAETGRKLEIEQRGVYLKCRVADCCLRGKPSRLQRQEYESGWQFSSDTLTANPIRGYVGFQRIQFLSQMLHLFSQ